ncbi:MAG: hypothetical protein JW936_03720 [Sedimentisphaerales bacterium]|nr:hypothetical protein [Sedimentisphaerales bacterium]
MNFKQLNDDVLFGRSKGKIIWQPRIQCWYDDKLFAGEKLPSPYDGMELPDIYRALGCSARPENKKNGYSKAFQRVEHKDVNVTTRKIDEWTTEIITKTPLGQQVEVQKQSPNNPGITHVKWPVETEEELKVATWRAENATWHFDQDIYSQMANYWGDLGSPTVMMPRVNIQDLYVNTMGVEKAIYAIYDWPDTIKAYFKALDQLHNRLIDVIIDSPIQIVNFGDNLHCGTLPPRLFEEYVIPAYLSRCQRLHETGRFVHAHWDGDTKAFLPYAQRTTLDGIEAITPKPQGDVTLEETKEALSDNIFLLDGIPAVLFDTTYPVTMLEEYAHRIIELFAPKLVLGISDELSSTGDIERVLLVGQIVENYNKQFDSCCS